MGIQIAPLLAGADIFGLAIGFGAQTLVRDVISGVFFLIEDVFRIGEYIESGTSTRGTVEHISFRTVALRHHTGPLTFVPYGLLGTVRNDSRDWVIDKFNIPLPLSDPEAPPIRPERHIPNSIIIVRRRLIGALARTLPRCPRCNAPIRK
jgi:small-conductance mechanosensitive channel